MCIVHRKGKCRPAPLACAQGGCSSCVEAVIQQNEALIHAVLQRTHRCGVPYADLVQEGRIALWLAVRGFDDRRGVAFSTYAWTAVERRIWSSIRQATRPQGHQEVQGSEEQLEVVLAQVWCEQVSGPLQQALKCLPSDLREVIEVSYGLNGQEARSLAAQGRRRGVSRERMRQVRNDALVLLRLPVLAGSLHRVWGLNTRQDQARLRALNQAWLSRWRRQRRAP